MTSVFDHYARYYDLLYRDKDYAAEVNYLVVQIRQQLPQAARILELGCGTGAHAEFLARMGFHVHGVDFSDTMLAQAEERKASLPAEIAQRLSFSSGDVRTVRTGETYDVVLSLFHVMSYQTTNTDFSSAMTTAACHLAPDGLFLFDYWYGPAVLLQKPDIRTKRLEDSQIKVIRIAEPVLHPNRNVVDVNYTVFVEAKDTGLIRQMQETHSMRYFFLPELANYGSPQLIECGNHAWMTTEPPCADSWAALRIMKRA
jgi:SAM-dependent methyltransferase